jgi:hypothetical protein
MIRQVLYYSEIWFSLTEFEWSNFFSKRKEKTVKKEKKNGPSAGRGENARLSRLALT